MVWQARAGAAAPGGDLHRRRLAREHRQPVAGRMAGEIDQDVDPVRLDAIRQFVLRQLEASTQVGDERHWSVISSCTRRTGIADDLERLIADGAAPAGRSARPNGS